MKGAICLKHRNRTFIIIFVVLVLVVGYRIWEQNQHTEPNPAQTIVDPDSHESEAIPVSSGDETQPDESDQTLATTFHVFYPYDTGTDFELKEVTAIVNLEENETPLERVSELLKEASSDGPETLVPVLGPDAEILSVEMMKDNIVKVNVNEQFISQMNAGSALEGQILKSLIKTLSSLYQAKGVMLRVNGEPYESGHYYFPEDEVIYADHPEL